MFYNDPVLNRENNFFLFETELQIMSELIKLTTVLLYIYMCTPQAERSGVTAIIFQWSYSECKWIESKSFIRIGLRFKILRSNRSPLEKLMRDSFTGKAPYQSNKTLLISVLRLVIKIAIGQTVSQTPLCPIYCPILLPNEGYRAGRIFLHLAMMFEGCDGFAISMPLFIIRVGGCYLGLFVLIVRTPPSGSPWTQCDTGVLFPELVDPVCVVECHTPHLHSR